MGIIPAQLAAKVIGLPSKRGFIFSAIASEATTGAKTITCATLLITSLIKIERMTTIRTRRKPFPEN